jgi:predicted adenine nucleotide alpha hydrolase (AANH) superfamily ATPase
MIQSCCSVNTKTGKIATVSASRFSFEFWTRILVKYFQLISSEAIPAMKILLHICCGPCALYPLKRIRACGHDVSGLFYNHNIHPYQEYFRRLEAVRMMAEQETLPLIVRDEYALEEFLANVAAEPARRCSYCYASRLRATAAAAASLGFEAFSASLLYSRYQRHEEIRQLGEQAGRDYGVIFYYEDFRSGWQEGIRLSKEMGLYRQQYCGCVYSEKERYLPQQKQDGGTLSSAANKPAGPAFERDGA